MGKTKEQILASLKLWGADQDADVPNVYWVQGRCVLLKQNQDGSWELEDL